MDEKNDADEIDDIMLPGFRYHPTDEELVGFYLKRKIQQRALPIELIKQVDIYKYDPWDLPKLASTGEKEWYFYCPRDCKYRNSARPNRVTGAGFWKATGTDRPIYSSDSAKCIGLKKSLVFYRGRAAKGLKTDWMMHEFQLPSSISDSASPKKILDKSLPANEAWAICRIFKKTNSMARRALSHSWASPIPETTASDIFNQGAQSTHFSSETISCTNETGPVFQLRNNYDLQQASTAGFSPQDVPSYEPMNPTVSKSSPFPAGLFSPLEISVLKVLLGGLPGPGEDDMGLRKYPSAAARASEWGNIRSIGFPFSLPPSDLPDAWKLNLPWDSPPCPSEMSTTCHE